MFYCGKCGVEWPHIHIMPMEDVLDTVSGDSDGLSGDVRSVIEEKRDRRYEDVKESIVRIGFKPGYEPVWDAYHGYPMIVNGHHRITALYDLGAQWCPDGRDNDPVYA